MTAQPDNWLKDPAASKLASRQRFAAGELLAGRFKIIRIYCCGWNGGRPLPRVEEAFA